MAYKLSTRNVKALLGKVPDAEKDGDSDLIRAIQNYGYKKEKVDEALFADFMRLMSAERPSEVADIPDERIILMLNSLNELADEVDFSDPLTNGTFAKVFMNTPGVSRKRRIL